MLICCDQQVAPDTQELPGNPLQGQRVCPSWDSPGMLGGTCG